MNSNTILYIIYLIATFTLYHTYQNDFNVFLLTLLIILGSFWCYLYINEYIDKLSDKIQNIEKIVENKINFLTHKLFNIN